MNIPSHHSRIKAAAELAAEGVYPEKGVMHGLMYGGVFVAGLGIGSTLGNLPEWAVAAFGLAAMAGGWFWGTSVERKYDEAVAYKAAEIEARRG